MNKNLNFPALLFGLLFFMTFTTNSHKPRIVESMDLGTYSISLNVKDISTSMTFYQKLGFEPVEGLGGVVQKWMILSNGATKIGLFQGMFPANTITFNPTELRTIYKIVKENGVNPIFETGFDKKEGPCTLSLMDPDGNPILIDQH